MIPIPRSLHPHLQWWLQEDDVLAGRSLHPSKTSANVNRCIKRRVGRSLKRTHCKKHLVPSGKQVAYQLPRTQGSMSSLKRVKGLCIHKIVLVGTDNTTVVSNINKEGGMRSGPPCALLWRILIWCTSNQVTQSPTHSRSAECGSRQGTQARPDHPNKVVSPSGGLPSNMQQVAPALNRPICHLILQQVAFVWVTGAGSPGHSSGCAQSVVAGSGSIHLPSFSHIGQTVMLQDSPCKRIIVIAPWFWGPGGHVQPNPTELAQTVDTTIPSDPSQKSDKS